MIRKLSLLLLMCLFTCTMFAQSETKPAQEYLTVKGLELKPGLTMKKALNHFLSKGITKRKEFEAAKKLKNVYWLEGRFFNHFFCKIYIHPLEDNPKIVGFIRIEFLESNSFSSLKSIYDEVKSALSEKYHLTYCTEEFNDPEVESSESDELKFQALINFKADFTTWFRPYGSSDEKERGDGYLSISRGTKGLANTYIVYTTIILKEKRKLENTEKNIRSLKTTCNSAIRRAL